MRICKLIPSCLDFTKNVLINRNKMLSARPIMSRLLQQTARRYHGEGHVKPPTMDELPVPSGSWQARHDAKQRQYNTALFIGLAFATFTLIVGKTSGLIYFNYSPPKSLD